MPHQQRSTWIAFICFAFLAFPEHGVYGIRGSSIAFHDRLDIREAGDVNKMSRKLGHDILDEKGSKSDSPSSTPSVSARPSASPAPSARPSIKASLSPSRSPSVVPTSFPTDNPTGIPSDLPSINPTYKPSQGKSSALFENLLLPQVLL